MKHLIMVLRGVLITILSVVVLGNVWLLVSQAVLKQDPPDIFGYSQLIVTSGSMEPAFSAGDVVIVKKGKDCRPGDIVTFRDSAGQLVTHRIVGTNEGRYITQGDANNTVDGELLDPLNVVATYVTYIPRVGEALLFLRSPLGLLVLAIVGFLLIELPIWLGRDGGTKGGRHAQRGKEEA